MSMGFLGRRAGWTVLAVILATTTLQGQETVARIREAGALAFAKGDFAEALPHFEELIRIQGGSQVSQVVASLERVYYHAALCLFLTGDFAGAETAFIRYNKKYPRGNFIHESHVYIADVQRFSGRLDQAIRSYEAALRRFTYMPDLRTDIHMAIARCHLAGNNWDRAVEPLRQAFESAPDIEGRNRCATLLATAYLKTLDMEAIYPMVPYLLTRASLAARSIAFNLAAIEAGDVLFGEERYREALWIHRLVYPYGEIQERTERYLDDLNRRLEYGRRYETQPRRLMRLQEWVAETDAELKMLQEQVENYDEPLLYRIARGYMEARRYREGCEVFLQLHETGSAEVADEALYLAFACAANVAPLDRAFDIGRRYMDTYPAGAWYDILTLMVAQLHAAGKNWPAVIQHLREVLQVRPEHQSAAECLYLLGYAHFMEEQFAPARERLKELQTRFPEGDLVDDAIYWSAMAAMFDGDFEPAEKDFTRLLEQARDSAYATDASYRRAVCNYALGDYAVSDERLAAFATRNPGHDLIGEVLVTRGDIAGALGRIDAAVGFYQEAMGVVTNQLNIEQFNHCAFQAGQILYDHQRYGDVRAHFARYLDMGREGSNPPLAIYWIGRSMWQMGERAGAARFYREASLKYGRDRQSVGVDMILDELVAAAGRSTPDVARVVWEDIALTIRAARDRADRVTMLRFQRLLLYHPDLQPGARETLLDQIVAGTNIPYASPAVLETMLSTAQARKQNALVESVARAIIVDFGETDYALDARMVLARRALGQAREMDSGAVARDGLYAEAEEHLTFIRNVHATSGEAAEALLMLGEIHLQYNRVKQAEQCYIDVLGVRGWRNLWPRALLGRGACAEAGRDWLRATAFYERIYVLYAGQRELVAQAYLKRAECLHRGFEDVKAVETLKAMLAQEDLGSYPEYVQARQLLSRLGSKLP